MKIMLCQMIKWAHPDEIWTEIFDRAKKKGKIRNTTLGDYNFEYALVNSKDGYGRGWRSSEGGIYELGIGRDVTNTIRDEENYGRIGLNYGGCAIVIEKALPRPDFADYVGLHEYVEANRDWFLDPYWDHAKACKIELGEVFEREDEFIDSYAAWLADLALKRDNIEDGYFSRAIPRYAEIIKEGKLSPRELLKNFKEELDCHIPSPIFIEGFIGNKN